MSAQGWAEDALDEDRLVRLTGELLGAFLATASRPGSSAAPPTSCAPPVPELIAEPDRARPCDVGAPSWYSPVGSNVLTTGLPQVAWVLTRPAGGSARRAG